MLLRDARAQLSGSKKKEKSPFTVGPVVLAVFLFVVVGSVCVTLLGADSSCKESSFLMD